MNDLDAKQFEAYRPLMFSIAYRMLGSATEAEDIVQESYLRYQTTSPEQITSHKALLTTVVTRLCLDHLQSAQVQRETYIALATRTHINRLGRMVRAGTAGRTARLHIDSLPDAVGGVDST